MKIASFDIFDTALVRKCGQPENVFFLTACRLFPSDSGMRDAFVAWRRDAERDAKMRKGGDVSLGDIYSCCDPRYRDAEALERAVESGMLVANPSVRGIIRQKRTEGYTICFISDMYLDSRWLGEVLRREECLMGDERVFVSVEYGARKSSGALYDVVRRAMECDGDRIEEWCHWGDNRHSDIVMARRHGLRASLVDFGYTDAERIMLQSAQHSANACILSSFVGLQRTARLVCGGEAHTEIAADFVAPAYIPYVAFLLDDARRRGVTDLYFLSRDSWILQRIAESVSSQMRMHYFFVSRKSLILPYLEASLRIAGCVDDRQAGVVLRTALLRVMDRNGVVRERVDKILSLLHTSLDEMDSLGIKFLYDRMLTPSDADDFLGKLFGAESPFPALLRKRCEERYEVLADYFRQEGLLPTVSGSAVSPADFRSAMVDVGWLGTSRLMINTILRAEHACDTLFYYFSVRGDVFPEECGRYVSFFCMPSTDTQLTFLLENYFSSSPYPTTVSHSRLSDGCVSPVFPDGASFCDTDITGANRRVSCWMAKELDAMGIDLSLLNSAGAEWCDVSLDILCAMRADIPLAPFTSENSIGNFAVVRRMSATELVRHIFAGVCVTGFDKGSLLFSVGHLLYPAMRRMHVWSARLRRFVYLKTRKK